MNSNIVKKPKWTEEDVKNMMANPVYAGVGPFEGIVPPAIWCAGAGKAIDNVGIKTYVARVRSILMELGLKVSPSLPESEGDPECLAKEILLKVQEANKGVTTFSGTPPFGYGIE